jgi:hypothetical protein
MPVNPFGFGEGSSEGPISDPVPTGRRAVMRPGSVPTLPSRFQGGPISSQGSIPQGAVATPVPRGRFFSGSPQTGTGGIRFPEFGPNQINTSQLTGNINFPNRTPALQLPDLDIPALLGGIDPSFQNQTFNPDTGRISGFSLLRPEFGGAPPLANGQPFQTAPWLQDPNFLQWYAERTQGNAAAANAEGREFDSTTQLLDLTANPNTRGLAEDAYRQFLSGVGPRGENASAGFTGTPGQIPGNQFTGGGGGFGFGGDFGGSQFDDPGTALLEDLLKARISELGNEPDDPRLAQFFADLDARVQELRGDPFSAEEEDQIRTRSLDQIGRNQDAAEARALEVLGSLGRAGTSGVNANVIAQLGDQFNQARAGAEQDFSEFALGERQRRRGIAFDLQREGQTLESLIEERRQQRRREQQSVASVLAGLGPQRFAEAAAFLNGLPAPQPISAQFQPLLAQGNQALINTQNDRLNSALRAQQAGAAAGDLGAGIAGAFGF